MTLLMAEGGTISKKSNPFRHVISFEQAACRLFDLQNGEPHALQHGHSRVIDADVVQERLGGGLGILAAGALHDGGGVDDLAAHVRRGLVHHGQLIGEGVGGVDDASVHGALLHLVGHLGDVGGIGHLAVGFQLGDIDAQGVQDLQGVGPYRNLLIAQAQQIQLVGGQVREGLDAGGVVVRHRQHHLVLHKVHPGIGVDQIVARGVGAGGVSGVQLIHLGLAGGNEQVTDRPFQNLIPQGSGGVKGEDQLHIRGHFLVEIGDLGEGGLHGGGGKDHHLHRLGGGLRGGIVGGGVRAVTAGGQGQGHGQSQEQGEQLFHGRSSFLDDNLFRRALQARRQADVILK
jgi:hypothetical protein